MPPQQQQSAAGFMLFIMVLWIIFPDVGTRTQTMILSDLAQDRLDRFWSALHVLNRTHWGDFAPAPSDADNARWLNLTGFREEDGLAWEDLGRFREKSRQLSQYAAPAMDGEELWETGDALPVWANASGILRGEWVKTPGSVLRGHDSYNLSEIYPSAHWIGAGMDWGRNMTGDQGKMVLRVEGNNSVTEYEQLPRNSAPLGGGEVRNVQATLEVEDTRGTRLNWGMRLWGAHWPRQGVIVLSTTSEKFEGIFALPHLTPSADYFQSSQMLLNQTLGDTLRAKEKSLFFDQDVPFSSDLERPTYSTDPSPYCEFIIYAQIQPPSPQDLGIVSHGAEQDTMKHLLRDIESELQVPLGAPIPKIPHLQMSAVAFSPDCGFFLSTKGPPEFPPGEAQHLTGLKKEVHLYRVNSWILMFGLVMFLQTYTLRSQMAQSCTPSTIARVSFWTVGAMFLFDGMVFLASSVWMSSATATFLPTLVLVFFAFLSTMINGSFLSKIHEVQLTEGRSRRDRNHQQTNNGQAAGQTPPASFLPPPVAASATGSQPSPPIIVPSDQDIDAEIAAATEAIPQRALIPQEEATPAQSFQAILGRFVFVGLASCALIISSTTWYPEVRAKFYNLCAFLYFSLWVPQIFRNAMRNCRRALRWQYVCGQSVLRCLPLGYFWLKHDNFLYAQTEPFSFLLLCAWLWIQIAILVAQEVVGPRFGIPAGWTPEAWDYHPVLREDSLETGGLPIGLVADDEHHSKSNDGGRTRSIDCAICREVLEVPVFRAGEETSSVTVTLARRTYMVTPCRHIFHTACLDGWMRFRLQCPICREDLPPQ